MSNQAIDPSYLQRLATRIKASAAGDKSDAREKPGSVHLVGGSKHLAALGQTEFLGARSGVSVLYPLTVALRRLGCPIIGAQGQPVTQDRYPGEAWVTF